MRSGSCYRSLDMGQSKGVPRKGDKSLIAISSLCVASTILGDGCMQSKLKPVPILPVDVALKEVPKSLCPTRNPQSVRAYQRAVQAAKEFSESLRPVSSGPNPLTSIKKGARPPLPGRYSDQDWISLMPPDGERWSKGSLNTFAVRLERSGAKLDAVVKATANGPWTPQSVNPNSSYENLVWNMPFPELANFKLVAKSLVARASYRADRRLPGAVSDLLAARAVGTNLCGHGFLIQHLVGIATEAVANRGIQRLVRNPGLSDRDLLALLGRQRPKRLARTAESLRFELVNCTVPMLALMPFDDHPSVLKDRELEVKEEENLAPSPEVEILAGHPNPFDRRATIGLAVAAFTELVEKCEKGDANLKLEQDPIAAMWPPESEEGRPSPETISRARANLSKVQNPFGHYALDQTLSVFSEMGKAELKSQNDAHATRVLIAAELFRRKNRREAASPTELVGPGLLQTWPKDAYSGKPFGFDAKRKIIWAAGEDKVDDGGKGSAGDALSPDKIWPLDGKFSTARATQRPQLR